MTTLLVWFRRDLRLGDNPALRAALDDADRVIPVYVDTREEEGEWTPGAASRWWRHQSLAALAEALETRGSRLVLRRGPALETLLALVRETGASGVYWNRLYEPASIARDREVKAGLRRDGVEARSFNGHVLIEPWEVETGAGRPYKVFSPFWRNVRARIGTPEALPGVRKLPGPARWPEAVALESLGLEPAVDWAQGFRERWRPGENGARQALDAFLDETLDGYGETRELPAVRGTSRLSPHLHHGEISVREVWNAVASAAPRAGEHAEAYLRELGWREFAHHVLYHFPTTPTEPLSPKYAAFPWREDRARLVEAWQRGLTGVPIVDAGMRELWATGWMHNRVRMIVASFLVKNVRAPWQEGARWFWDTLVDADLANNTLGWQWSAGSGADAAPYFRIFNPVRQSERFDPDGAYVKRWVPELARLSSKHVHDPGSAPPEALASAGVVLGEHYPAPILDLRTTRAEALEAFGTISQD